MKNLIFKMDNAGCGNYRVTLPYTNLSNNYKKDSFIVVDKNNFNILANKVFLEDLDNIIFQRPFSLNEEKVLDQLVNIRHHEKLKFKLIYESDDELTSAPDYNSACIMSQNPTILENLKYFDKFILSTPYMKKMFVEKYNVSENKIHVFKNYVFREYMYSKIEVESKEEFTKRRKRILIAGSSTHFSRIKKLNGDYLDNVVNLIHYIVNSDEYELCLIGTVPFFLYQYFTESKNNAIFNPFDGENSVSVKEEYKDSLKVFKWTNFTNYFNLLKDIDPDFLIASLKENDFNKCKSWIKQMEAYSLPKTVFIGNVFPDSPYEDQANSNCMFTEESLVDYLKNTLIMGEDYNWFYRQLKSQKEYLVKNELFFEDNIERYYEILEK